MKKSRNKILTTGEFKGISYRAWNILQLNRMDNIYLFTEHYKREGNFLSLRQCGPKLDLELTEYCLNLLNQQFQPVVPVQQDLEETAEFIQEIANGREPEFKIETHIEAIRSVESEFLELSDRSRNMLMRNGIVGPEKTLNYFEIHGSFLDLNHCGEATERELCAFCEGFLSKSLA